MKQIKILFALLCFALSVVGCTKELAIEAPTTVTPLIQIAPFPAFGDGAQTRAIGTPDAGKTTWASGDQVLLSLQIKNVNGETHSALLFVLTYNGTAWTSTPSLDKVTKPDYLASTFNITAYYAPNYDMEASLITGEPELKLKQGKVAGTDEVLAYTTNAQITEDVTIDFASAARTYSRLRVATLPNTTIKVEVTNFRPIAPIVNPITDTYTLTADNKGNAYLYGKWSGDITVSTTDATPVELAKKTGVTSVANKSYAIDAFPAATKYNALGKGTATEPWLICNLAQLQNMNTATAANSKIFEGNHLKLLNDIDCKNVVFTPIGNYSARFAGTFDGGGRTISNLTLGSVSNNSTVYSGLFAYAAGVNISNLTLLDPRLSATAKENATHIGALIGFVSAANASEATTITNCHVRLSDDSKAAFEPTYTELQFLGGLIGQCGYTTLIACSSAIPVIHVDKTSGGLIGYGGNSTTLIGCRTTGAVGGNNAGGLMGTCDATSNIIVGCYATGTLSGKFMGGFVGDARNITVLSSYYTGGENSGQYLGSFIGQNGASKAKPINIYYTAATTDWGTNGVGRYGNANYNHIGIKLGCTPDALHAAMVNAGAETKWSTDPAFAALGNKKLSEIWGNATGAAPKLWWEW